MDTLARLEKITGQTESEIVSIDGRVSVFNKYGVVSTGSTSSDARITEEDKKAFLELFGGD